MKNQVKTKQKYLGLRCPKCNNPTHKIVLKIYGCCYGCVLRNGIEDKHIEQTRDVKGWLKKHKEK